MVLTNLDQITRLTLLERSLPLHYYLEILLHASSCLRELTIDTLKIVNYVELPVNNYFAIDLPNDFVDDVALTIPVGQYLHPVPKNDSITNIRKHDSSGNFIPFADITQTNGETLFGFNSNWLLFWNINDYGEPTGRYFGAHGAGKLNGYKLVKERNQIQLTESFTSPTAVLIYISNGQSSDNASQIETVAIATIQAYTDWKRSPYADNKDSPPARNYYNQRRLLVAREDDLTDTDIRNIVLKSYTAAYKS